MTGLWRPVCLIGLAGALVLSSSGCTDYTYFNVHVSVDPSVVDTSSLPTTPTLEQIDDCFFYVLDKSGRSIEGAGKELVTTESSKQGTQTCKLGYTNRDVGVLDYSTTRGSGTLTFLVSMTKYESTVTTTFLDGLAKGEGPVNQGGAIYVDLVVKACDPNPSTTGNPCNPVGVSR